MNHLDRHRHRRAFPTFERRTRAAPNPYGSNEHCVIESPYNTMRLRRAGAAMTTRSEVHLKLTFIIINHSSTRMGDEENSGRFWRARANRLKRLTRGVRSKSVEGDAREDADGKDDDGDVSDVSPVSTRDGDADVDAAAWALTMRETARVDARPSMWTPRPCPTTMETSTSGSRWSESRGRRRRDADGAAGDALDDARSLDSLRAGYKTLLREVTARHARVREDMEREIASLRDRVRELETAADARDAGAARRRSPRREVLAPRSPGDDAVMCELSPMSAADRTPPPMPRESPESARADEKENEDAV